MPRYNFNFYSIFRIVILAIILTFYFFSIITISKTSTGFLDFGKFYVSANLFYQGKSIYSPISVDAFEEVTGEIGLKITRDTMHPNLNLPPSTLLFLTIGLINIRNAYILWSILSIILGLIASWLLYNSYRDRFSRKYLISIPIFLFAFFPTYITIIYGQVSLLLLFIIVLAWSALRSEYEIIAGIFFGFALNIKIFTGLFLIVFLLQKRFKLIFWYVGSFLIINILAFVTFGIETYIEFINNLSAITWYSASWNASILGFYTRILGGSEGKPLINLPELAYGLNYASTIILLLILAWAVKTQRNKNIKMYDDLVFSLGIVFMLLLSPLGWMYYFVLLIIPVIILWQVKDTRYITYFRVLIIIAWILSSIPHVLTPSPEIKTIDMFVWGGSYFYALLLFSFLILWAILIINQKSSKI